MEGAIITAVITLLVGLLVLFLAVSFIRGKNLNLLAGYSSMSESEKAQTDFKRLGLISGKSLLVISVIMFVFSAISFMAAFQIVSKAVFVISSIVVPIVIIAVTIASTIKAMK